MSEHGVMIVGAGIGGLTAALSLHAAGIECVIVEAAPELHPLGVGINLQPHAVRELTELGLADELAAGAVATTFMTFTDRHGGEIVSMPRGRLAGYHWPQYSIHRGALQTILLAAVTERLGAGSVRLGTRFEGFTQDATGTTVTVQDVATRQKRREQVDVLVGADGINSTVRAALHPSGGPLRWSGIQMWRGTAEAEPVLNGSTVLVAGSNLAARFISYHISADNPRLINWVAEVKLGEPGVLEHASWGKRGHVEDVVPHFADWKYPHLDIAALIEATPRILEYPMVDRDPLPRWGHRRATLLGDAAHPMYPIGSNGGSQAILDARVLARWLATDADPATALAGYEAERRPPTSALVLAHRSLPIEKTIRLVLERAPDGFDDIADVLSADERAALIKAQQGITDTDVQTLNDRRSWSVAPLACTSC